MVHEIIISQDDDIDRVPTGHRNLLSSINNKRLICSFEIVAMRKLSSIITLCCVVVPFCASFVGCIQDIEDIPALNTLNSK